ncbi:hypothetical protein LMG18101_05070 [Ralstonia flaminis]|uniref:Uncharacterized protein n=1 Tax=Ralstonia flaminis TaxID=3058597 RepID=A0ABN9JVH6_9RALS|nr:hypothetical protein LMG18101_05070 [Ralstonia sp. LMG 18101]
MRQLTQLVVLVNLKLRVRNAIVAGDIHPALGKLAALVVRVVVINTSGISRLDCLAVQIVLRVGVAVSGLARRSVAVHRSRRGSGGVLGLQHNVAVGIAPEFRQRRERGAVVGAGAGGGRHCTDAAQYVVVGVRFAASRVGHAGLVADRVVGVRGRQVAARARPVGRRAVFNVDTRLAGLAIGTVKSVRGGTVIRRTGRRTVADLRPAARRDGVCVLRLRHDVACSVEVLGGQIAQRVHCGNLIAPQVEIVGGGRPVVGSGIAQLADLHGVAKGVVRRARGLACREILSTRSGTGIVGKCLWLHELHHTTQLVVGGQNRAVKAVVHPRGIDGTFHCRARGCAGRVGEGGARQTGTGGITHQARYLAKCVARVAGDIALGIHFVEQLAGGVVRLRAAVARNVLAAHGIAEDVVVGLGRERHDRVATSSATVLAIGRHVAQRLGVHAHRRERRSDLAAQRVVLVARGALFRPPGCFSTRNQVAKAVVLITRDDRYADVLRHLQAAVRPTRRHRDRGHQRRCFLGQSTHCIVGVRPDSAQLVGIGQLLAQAVVGVRFRTTQRVGAGDEVARGVVRVGIRLIQRGGAHHGCADRICVGSHRRGNGKCVLRGPNNLADAVVLRLFHIAERVDRVDLPVAGVVAAALDPVIRRICTQKPTQRRQCRRDG